MTDSLAKPVQLEHHKPSARTLSSKKCLDSARTGFRAGEHRAMLNRVSAKVLSRHRWWLVGMPGKELVTVDREGMHRKFEMKLDPGARFSKDFCPLNFRGPMNVGNQLLVPTDHGFHLGDPILNSWKALPVQPDGFKSPTSAAFDPTSRTLLFGEERNKHTATFNLDTQTWSPVRDNGSSWHGNGWETWDTLHYLRGRIVWGGDGFYSAINRVPRGMSPDGKREYERLMDMRGYEWPDDDISLAKYDSEKMQWHEVDVELPEGLSWEQIIMLHLSESNGALMVFVECCDPDKSRMTRLSGGKLRVCEWFGEEAAKLVSTTTVQENSSEVTQTTMEDEYSLPLEVSGRDGVYFWYGEWSNRVVGYMEEEDRWIELNPSCQLYKICYFRAADDH